jgi:hypothetical protein
MAEKFMATEEPQRVDSSRADAEWKADPGLGNIIHDKDSKASAHFINLTSSPDS